MPSEYTRIGANVEARKQGDFLYLRIQVEEDGERKTVKKSNSGKSFIIGSTGGNQDLGLVSDDLMDIVAGLNVYEPIPKDER